MKQISESQNVVSIMILFGDHRTSWSQFFWIGALLDPWVSFVKVCHLSPPLFCNIYWIVITVQNSRERPARRKEPAGWGAALDGSTMSDFWSQLQRCPSQFSPIRAKAQSSMMRVVSDWTRTWTSVSKLQIYYPFNLLCAYVHHTSLDQLWSWERQR